MTTIYVLTEGEYSDYRIVALCSTREKAEQAQVLIPDSNVEEYELDSLTIPEHPPGCSIWQVNIDAKTNTIYTTYPIPYYRFESFVPTEDYAENIYGWMPSLYRVRCWARDKEHAEKIALDKFYQWVWGK